MADSQSFDPESLEIQESELEALGAHDLEVELPEAQPEQEGQTPENASEAASEADARTDGGLPAGEGAEVVAGDAETTEHPAQEKTAEAAQPLSFEPLGGQRVRSNGDNLDLLLDVPLRVTVELGRTEMPIREVLGLTPGSVVELSKIAGEPVDILVNGKLIARGEVVVIDDMFGVRVTDIIPPSARVRSLGR
ncbi:MAG: flagellar motor switch protein FliN [Anaerolineae bacterium]|nr:flagellar motor switch protein FliN [Anaerolineae bacterium]